MQYLILLTVQEQNSCVGRQADSITVNVDYQIENVKTVFAVPELDSAGMLNFVMTLPEFAVGKLLMTVITLANSAGSTDSEPIYTRKFYTLVFIFHLMLWSRDHITFEISSY